MLNLCSLLEDTARRVPDRDAIVQGDVRLTYGELNARADRVAHQLASRGIGRGSRVALSCLNLPDFPIAYYGILKSGATVVPLNVLLKQSEVNYILRDSAADAYLCFAGTPELPMGRIGFEASDGTAAAENFYLLGDAASLEKGMLRLADHLEEIDGEYPSAPTEATDTAVILYTSGTTGQPKGAELSHANMLLNALTANRLFGMRPGLVDVHLVSLPLFHSFGQSVQMNAGIAVGATLLLMAKFDAGTALELMVKEHVTVFAGVPTMYWALLNAIDDGVDVTAIAQHLRLSIAGGSALPVEILESFERRFGVQIREGYGLSETSPLATFSDPDLPPRPGSIGRPVWGVELKLVDDQWNTVPDDPTTVGEIAIRGHNVMKGYFNRPEATAEAMRDGWLKSGDLARRDADGFYYIVDRAKDLILRGGYNVYPREVEELLMTHPAVSLVAVAGVPHAKLSEEVKAWVVLAPGSTATEAELVAWCRDSLASYKYPRHVDFVDALPMTATGKILKRELPGTSTYGSSHRPPQGAVPAPTSTNATRNGR